MLMNNAVNPDKTRPFPWKCGKCRQREVYPLEEDYTTEVVHDGRSYTVRVPALRIFRCRNCGEVVLDTEANRQISQAFRRQAGLLAPEEIRQKREALGLTQKQVAERLEVAAATLCRWETGGQIQQRSLDKLLRLFFDLPEVRSFLTSRREPQDGDKFHHKPTEEQRDRARRFRLTPTRQCTPPAGSAAEPKEQRELRAGGTPAGD